MKFYKHISIIDDLHDFLSGASYIQIYPFSIT